MRLASRQHNDKQSGFSLLEVLVAFAIMAMSLGLLYRASGGTVQQINVSDAHQRANLLAESLMASRDAVPAGGWTDSGRNSGFQWRVASTPYPTSAQSSAPHAVKLHKVDFWVSWEDDARTRTMTWSTLLPELRATQEKSAP